MTAGDDCGLPVRPGCCFGANPQGILRELNLAEELQSSDSNASNSQHPPRLSMGERYMSLSLPGEDLLYFLSLSHFLPLVICIQRRVSQPKHSPTPDKIYHRQNMSALNCNDLIIPFFFFQLVKCKSQWAKCYSCKRRQNKSPNDILSFFRFTVREKRRGEALCKQADLTN